MARSMIAQELMMPSYTPKQIREAGALAQALGFTLAACPYTMNSPEVKHWVRGYIDSIKHHLRKDY